MSFKGFALFGMMVLIGCSQLPGDGNNITEGVTIIKSGIYSEYPQAGKLQKVINSKEDFTDQWNKVHTGYSQVPELPNVNFNKRRVALIMLETKPTGGFKIGDIEIYESEDKRVITYSEIVPGDDCIVTMAQTRPYTFISYPSKSIGVQFTKEDDIINNCSE